MWNISFSRIKFRKKSENQNGFKGLLQKMLRSLLLFLPGLLLLFCSQSKDYILVLDTSGSMSTGDRVIDKVKASLPLFMDHVAEGDTITLVTFDSQPNVRDSYPIGSQEDKERFIDQVEQLEALGAYTDMEAMVIALKGLSDDMRLSGRELYIVVMSDGLDDPPPWLEKRDPLALESLKQESPLREMDQPYIYYLSLGLLKDKQLEERLSQLSTNVTTLEDPSQILGDVAADVESRETKKTLRFYSILYLLLAFLSLAGFFAFVIYRIYRFSNRHRFQGLLSYYDTVSGPFLKEQYRLGKLKRNKMLFGSRPGANLKISELALKNNLLLKAVHRGGEVCLKPRRKDLALFKFDGQKRKNLISKGDKFQISNMFFEYTNGDQN